MPMIRSLAEVVLFVQDMEKSLAFYRDVLGLTVISPEGPGAVFLRVGEADGGVPQQIVLAPRPEGVRAAHGRRSEGQLHHIGLEVAAADLEMERERLQGLGMDVRSGEHPFLPVKAYYVNDPDGNEIEIVARWG